MSNVFEDKIRELAYVLWQESGCPIGRDLDFWLQAEAAVNAVPAAAPKVKKAPAKSKATAAKKAPAKPRAKAAKTD